MKKLLWCGFLYMAISAAPLQADARSELAMDAAKAVASRFGAKVAAKGLPALAARIETFAARYGHETFQAVRKVGPQAFELVEAAGSQGARAMRILAVHGEAGATCILKRPAAMAQFLKFGEQGAVALCKHPGVAEQVVERGGLAAVKAMASVGAQNGRRVAMLMEGELGHMAKSQEVLEVIAKYGDRAANFVWNNKGALATGAALAVFLNDPEPFLNGAQEITKVAGNTVVGVTKVAGEHVVAPVIGGVFTAVNYAIAGIAVLIVACAVLMWKYGVPRPESIKAVSAAIRHK